MILTKIVKKYVEPAIAKIAGRIFWPISYVSIIAEKDGKIAALETDEYELPGGMIKYGENPGETARRELREETGLRSAEIELKRIEYTFLGIMHLFTVKSEGELGKETWEGRPVLLDRKKLKEKTWRKRHKEIVEQIEEKET